MAELDLWPLFEIMLAAALDRMPADTYLILSTAPGRDDPGRYVQFARFDDGLRTESVADTFLPPGALSDADIRVLNTLGFCAPSVSVEEMTCYDTAKGSPNWYRDLSEPVPVFDAASVAVRALREVHGISSPATLCCCAFAEALATMPDPALGLVCVGERDWDRVDDLWQPASELDVTTLTDRRRYFDALEQLAQDGDLPERPVEEARVLREMGGSLRDSALR